MDYTCTQRIGRHAQTHSVLELDRTIEFHHEAPIPFAALVTHMQIDSHSHHLTEYSRIIPNSQIQF